MHLELPKKQNIVLIVKLQLFLYDVRGYRMNDRDFKLSSTVPGLQILRKFWSSLQAPATRSYVRISELLIVVDDLPSSFFFPKRRST